MIFRIGDHRSIYFIIKKNDDNTIEVKLTIGTTIRKVKKVMLILSYFIPSLNVFVQDQLEYFFPHNESKLKKKRKCSRIERINNVRDWEGDRDKKKGYDDSDVRMILRDIIMNGEL